MLSKQVQMKQMPKAHLFRIIVKSEIEMKIQMILQYVSRQRVKVKSLRKEHLVNLNKSLQLKLVSRSACLKIGCFLVSFLWLYFLNSNFTYWVFLTNHTDINEGTFSKFELPHETALNQNEMYKMKNKNTT